MSELVLDHLPSSIFLFFFFIHSFFLLNLLVVVLSGSGGAIFDPGNNQNWTNQLSKGGEE